MDKLSYPWQTSFYTNDWALRYRQFNGFLGKDFWQISSGDDMIDKKSGKHLLVEQVIIMLGSNDNAKVNLVKSIELLQSLIGFNKMICGNYLISQDHAKRSPNAYHNQVIKLQLIQPVILYDCEKTLKNIEQLCGRDEQKNCATLGYLVALDMDILAIKSMNGWHKLHERFPLKNHERYCLGLV